VGRYDQRGGLTAPMSRGYGRTVACLSPARLLGGLTADGVRPRGAIRSAGAPLVSPTVCRWRVGRPARGGRVTGAVVARPLPWRRRAGVGDERHPADHEDPSRRGPSPFRLHRDSSGRWPPPGSGPGLAWVQREVVERFCEPVFPFVSPPTLRSERWETRAGLQLRSKVAPDRARWPKSISSGCWSSPGR
jgi:hypothetical protein